MGRRTDEDIIPEVSIQVAGVLNRLASPIVPLSDQPVASRRAVNGARSGAEYHVDSPLRPEHVVPAVEHTLNAVRQELDHHINGGGPYTWDNLLAPLEAALQRLHQVWSPVSHLNAVCNSKELREAYNTCLPQLSAFETELGQHQGLYQAIQSIADSDQFEQLDAAQRKSIENRLRDFRLSGIALEAKQRERFKEIQQRLSALQSRFQENVLDATHAWKKRVSDETLLSGLPETAKALMRQTAERENYDGWLLTLEFPSYFPVITYADERALREEMYTAYVTRASDRGPHAGQWDNSGIMEEILELRQEAARLIGFANFAERSLETKMASTPRQVLDFLNDLRGRDIPGELSWRKTPVF